MNLPIEAYPDVADTWVQIITQWPGQVGEEVERQITVPTERVMNGVPKQNAIRSTSIAGLSVVTLIFEDGTDSYFARQQVLERLGQIDLPDGVTPSLGPLASPVGEILRYRLVNCAQTRAPECSAQDSDVPPRSLNDVKDLEEFVVERELLATPGVADVTSFGGTVKQYQVLVDPSKLAARGLTLTDGETARTNANGNAGGGVIAYGPESLNVRGIGLLLGPEQIADVAMSAVHDGVPRSACETWPRCVHRSATGRAWGGSRSTPIARRRGSDDSAAQRRASSDGARAGPRTHRRPQPAHPAARREAEPVPRIALT